MDAFMSGSGFTLATVLRLIFVVLNGFGSELRVEPMNRSSSVFRVSCAALLNGSSVLLTSFSMQLLVTE